MRRLTTIMAAACAAMLLAGTPLAAAQQTATFEQTVADLKSDDPAVRYKAVRALKQAAYEEAAVPLAATITDPEDAIQIEAIGAELNLFLVDKVVPRKRVGLIVEVRNSVAAEAVFSSGPDAIDPRQVPAEVLTALRAAAQDQNPRVAIEALYALGVLGINANGRERATLLASAAPELAAMLGAESVETRAGAIRVIGRLYAWRPGDASADQAVGDGLVTSLNERQTPMRIAAMDALGALRYERALQALTDLFHHYERGSEAAAAMGAIARIAHSSSVPLFVAGLASKDSAVKAAAIEGLARVGDPSRATSIADAVGTDHTEAVTLAAQFAGVRLSNAPVDLLVDGLTRPRSHDAAFRYLVEIARGRTSALAVYTQSQDALVRAGVVGALGLSGDPDAVPIVRRLQQDPDPSVSRAAARAAARLAAGPARQP